ncbi:MAG: flagellar hook-length control protein FliK [Deltaproteobacteria bacterium]|nr:flagellar hook-length control protein FliK [Deltaproteobacteria bacterium]
MVDEASKYVERRTMDRADQLREADKPKPPRKEGKSTFDEMLEQSKQLQQGAVNTKTQSKTTTQQAIQEMEKRQERSRDQSKDRDKEDEHKQDSRDGKSQTGVVTRKVIGKTGSDKQDGGSGGHSFEGGGSGSQKGERFLTKGKKVGEMNLQGTHKPFGKQFQLQLAKSETQLPKTLPQEVMNQLVRYVRIGLSREGMKELELQLHEKVFKGLRLRLSANHGRVKIHFLAANQEVRELFQRESANIEQQLVSKGIAVEEIRVT